MENKAPKNNVCPKQEACNCIFFQHWVTGGAHEALEGWKPRGPFPITIIFATVFGLTEKKFPNHSYRFKTGHDNEDKNEEDKENRSIWKLSENCHVDICSLDFKIYKIYVLCTLKFHNEFSLNILEFLVR